MSTSAVLTIHDGLDEHFPIEVTDLNPDPEIAVMIDGSSSALDLDGAVALRDHLSAWIARQHAQHPVT